MCHVAHTGEIRNAYKSLLKTQQEKRPLEGQRDVGRRIMAEIYCRMLAGLNVSG
jgi:hypothetical protein